jgi:hypothetical protein
MNYVMTALSHQTNECQIIAEIRNMVNSGADINARSRNGSTILHLAAKEGASCLIDFLLQSGAQVNHRNLEGFSALDYASTSFLRSRKSKAPASVTARSFKSVLRLMPHTLSRKKSKLFQPIAQVEPETSPETSEDLTAADRSLAAMMRLREYGAQMSKRLRPPSLDPHYALGNVPDEFRYCWRDCMIPTCSGLI